MGNCGTRERPIKVRQPVNEEIKVEIEQFQTRENKIDYQTLDGFAKLPVEPIEALKLDCGVCLELIDSKCAVWACTTCKNLVHYDCMMRWSKRQIKCILCNAEYPKIEKTCYCSNMVNPPHNPGEIRPYSCNQVCLKKLTDECDHICMEVCHPGQCKPCLEGETCHCGKITFKVKCMGSVINSLKTCDQVCGKMTSCGIHFCKHVCHSGDCPPCSSTQPRICQDCGREGEKLCGMPFKCKRQCGKNLSCGRHTCTKTCHLGDCDPCLIKTISCHCKKKEVVLNCIDDFEQFNFNCGQVCGIRFPCGHSCEKTCHIANTCICEKIIEAKCFTCKEVLYHNCGEPPRCFNGC